jgi:pteridine reductase
MAPDRKVALVTGGAKRVGRAIVEKLAASGFDVAFTFYRSDAEAAEVRRALDRSGAKVVAVPADLSAFGSVDLVGDVVERQFGRLDVLVNNASAYTPGTLDQTDEALIGRLMQLHVTAPLRLCQRFAPVLRANRGHVVNMVDLLAERPWPQYLAYCASKAALANLTLGLARELAPEVTVNGIAPGVVEWPDDYPEADRAKYLQRVPLARAGTPDDVAGMVLYLCTAGSYLTGQILRLDGGRSIT